MDLYELWDKLSKATNSKSLLKKHLTPDLFNQLKGLYTKHSGNLADVIRSGVNNPDSEVGVYATDPDAYIVYAPLLDKVIMDYHQVTELKQPEPDYGRDQVEKSQDMHLDPEGKHVLSTTVRLSRCHENFGFAPTTCIKDKTYLEWLSVKALKTLDGELKGTYYPLKDMTPETQKQLTADNFLFKDDDRFLREANIYKDWPGGRGVFHTPNKKFLAWVNQEDHLRLFSTQKGGNLKEVYLRLITAIEKLEKQVSFTRFPHLGYLTFCPSNLGSTLRASVHIKIPLLSRQPDFKTLCHKLKLQARGIQGEHSGSAGGVYDISNKRRLGLTEYEAIMEMKNGVKAILAKEKELEKGKKIIKK